jgi:uncharacterized membrane protein (DUF373 family)
VSQPVAPPQPENIHTQRRGREAFLTGLLGWAEDIVYAAIAVLLGCAALVALGSSAFALVGTLAAGQGGAGAALAVLDSILLTLIFVELFHTVRMSIREHALAVQSIVAVGLIATVRRILVLSAEGKQIFQGEAEFFRRAMIETALLAGLVLALVAAMILLRRVTAPKQELSAEDEPRETPRGPAEQPD